MNKYIAVFIITFKAQVIYRFDVMMTTVSTVWRVLFAWILWGALFAEDQYIGNFTFHTMLSYYVVNSFLTSIQLSERVLIEVSTRIRSGTFSKYMIIPTNPQLHFLAQTLGASAYYAFFSIVAAGFCCVVFRIPIRFTTDIYTILLAILLMLLGLMFMTGYQFFIGVLAFQFQDVELFRHVQGSLIAFLTGSIIPLSLLPESMISILRYLPFSYISYLPAMLITGQNDCLEGLWGIGILSVWTIGFIWLGNHSYEHLRVKFDGVGI